MDTLSYTEAYVLSALRALKEDADIDKIINLLMGFHICNFIGTVKNSKEDDLNKKMEDLWKESGFLAVLHKGKALKRLEIKKIKICDKVIVNDVNIKNNMDLILNNSITKKCVSHFTKKINFSFKVDKRKNSKYEIRFFWPSNLYPEIYDLYGLVFNKKDYAHTLTRDKYILINNDINVKIRKDELQIKPYIKSIDNISIFNKKKKIKFPIKIKKIQNLFQQKIISDPSILKTPEELITKLLDFSGACYIDVLKEKYVRKLGERTKIEFALIKIQQKEWKTICIESKSIQKVLALSLLIDQENAEKLTYNAFLHKYGKGESRAPGAK